MLEVGDIVRLVGQNTSECYKFKLAVVVKIDSWGTAFIDFFPFYGTYFDHGERSKLDHHTVYTADMNNLQKME